MFLQTDHLNSAFDEVERNIYNSKQLYSTYTTASRAASIPSLTYCSWRTEINSSEEKETKEPKSNTTSQLSYCSSVLYQHLMIVQF
ncbi:hypothetical protein Gasu2_29730 [Galdieria sulphuraria]|nr:hypothetical protein Gasu2_29730 [Galdieria sulphuraria]